MEQKSLASDVRFQLRRRLFSANLGEYDTTQQGK
jgi:hypothetical protein